MAHHASVADILKGKLDPGESSVALRGWLQHRRTTGGIQFLLFRDGTGTIQCTAKRDLLGDEGFEEVQKTPLESTVEIIGQVRKDPRAPRGVELVLSKFAVMYPALGKFPIAKKYHGPEFLLDHRHLWLRSEKMQTIMRLRSRFIEEARRWLVDHGYLEVQVPTLVTAAVEGGATLFEVKYFDQKAYLSQSWQLYAEAMITGLGKIFTLAPSFRAEKSRTRRHLTEYWHLEVEEPWVDLDGLLRMEEQFVSDVCRSIAAAVPDDLTYLGRDPSYLSSISSPFPRITYDEAVKILQKQDSKLKWGTDLGWEQEKQLAVKFKSPFFVTHYPKGVKAFYHLPDPQRPEVTLSADLLAPEGYGEITGGGQRIHDYQQLVSRMKEEGMEPKAYQWYLDLRKYGTVPHSGFGLGVERTVAWICKLKHIRDAIAFPRLINRVYP